MAGCADHVCREVTQREFTVLRVIDGDTFVVSYDGEPTSVCMLAPVGEPYDPAVRFDTPERDEPGFESARDALRSQIEARRVRLAFPLNHKRDHFGRLLALVVMEKQNAETADDP